MSDTVTFQDAQSLPASPSRIVARIGVSNKGTVGEVYELPGASQAGVVNTLGFGPLAAASKRGVRFGGASFAIRAAQASAGTVSSVTKTGDGPAMSAAASLATATEAAGPWFAFPSLKFTVRTGGALGVARVDFSYDGTTIHETVDLQPELPASIVGTVDLNALTLADLNTLTVDLTDVDGANPAAVTLTTPSSVANLITQIDAIAGATASLVAGKYLKISGATLGATGSIENGNGTANTLLGLTNGQTADGIASTYVIPGAGAVTTWAAGTYVAGTTYTLSTTAPTMSIAGMQTAAQALRDSGVAFGVLHIVQEPVDGTDVLAWQTALSAITDAWATAEENAIDVKWVIGSSLGTVGSANWAANDQGVKTALANTGQNHKFHTIPHGDVFLDWEEYSGRHRAQLAVPYVERLAAYPLNIDPALGFNGALANCYLKSITGTPARTEAAATIKMQDSGFSVLMNAQQTPHVRKGRTRAPTTSQFTGESTARAANECARVARSVAARYNAATPLLQPNGQLRDLDAAAILQDFQAAMDEQLLKPGYASAAIVELLPLTTVGGADRLHVRIVFQRLAQIEGVDMVIVVTNQTIAIAEAA